MTLAGTHAHRSARTAFAHILLLWFCCFAALTESVRAQISLPVLVGHISTAAGGANQVCTGASNMIGDGCLAPSAILSGPNGVAVDSHGNLYIADTANARIREVAALTGVVTTVAGGGTGCSLSSIGDGCSATSAVLGSPSGVALDAAGNIYIADAGHFRIRVVNTSTTKALVVAGVTINPGDIETVAGTGTQCSPCETKNGNGKATSVALGIPASIAVDTSGNIYISDTQSLWVSAINAASTQTTLLGITIPAGNISIVAGGAGSICNTNNNGCKAIDASFDKPFSVAVDSTGNLYVADNFDVIYKIGASSSVESTITLVAGVFRATGTGSSCANGSATSATSTALNSPSGLAVDNSGNIYIADTGDQCIRVVNTSPISTIAIAGISIAPGDMVTIAGTGKPGFNGDSPLGLPATNSELNGPMALALDNAQDLYIADTSNNRVRALLVAGITLTGTVTGAGAGVICGFTGTVVFGSGACSGSEGVPFFSGTRSYQYRKGTIVTLVAEEPLGTPVCSAFGGWGGACSGVSGECRITMSTSEAFSGSFEKLNAPGCSGP
jgi:sugar lactone lactonase YvrE